MKIMAKQTKINEKQKTNPILWFLFAIVIPVIVVLTLVIMMLTVSGVNVVDLAKNVGSHIPGVSSLVTTDDEKQAEQKEEKLKATIKQKDERIEELERNTDDLETKMEDMELEAEKRRNKTSDKHTDNPDADIGKNESSGQQSSIKSIAASFKDMQPKKAARIFEKLDNDESIALLENLSNKVRGAIFQEMDPELAATLTKKLMDQD